MSRFWAHLGDTTDMYDTEADAKDAAEAAFEFYRNNAGEGYDEELEYVAWGEVRERVVETLRRPWCEEAGCDLDDPTHDASKHPFDEHVEYELQAVEPSPIPMVLHCPACGAQHVDAPDEAVGWANPPHRSHLCHGCGHVWRPADVPTTGVAAIATRGERDASAPTVVRPVVRWFAERMELKLREHDEKRGPRGWKDASLRSLLARTHEELDELRNELIAESSTVTRVVNEAVDVANLAMMVADKARGCP